MKRSARHTGVLLLVAVIGLSVLGAAYALWFEDLQLTANVSTGTLDADLSLHDIDVDNGGSGAVGLPVVAVNPPPGSVSALLASNYGAFAAFPENKPPTGCAGTLGTFGSAPTNANDATDTNLLTLSMSGLYPYAGCEYEIDIQNSGTVPFHLGINGVTFTCAPVGPQCTAATSGGAPWSIGLAGSSESGCAEVLNSIWTFTGTPHQISTESGPIQLHTGDDIVCRFKLILDQNAAAEGLTLTLTATFKAYQWNENPYGP